MKCFGVSGSLRFLSILKGHNVNQEFQRGNRLSEGIDRLSPFPLYFSLLSLVRTALHYLNAWNRLFGWQILGSGDF